MFIGKDNFIWWIGVVEDIDDPLTLGRCRVRIYGYHGDAKTVATKDLPWAVAIHPLNTPNLFGTPRIGWWVFGFFLDSIEAQEPAMLGYFPANPTEQSGYHGIIPTNFSPNFEKVASEKSVVLDINGSKLEFIEGGKVKLYAGTELTISGPHVKMQFEESPNNSTVSPVTDFDKVTDTPVFNSSEQKAETKTEIERIALAKPYFSSPIEEEAKVNAEDWEGTPSFKITVIGPTGEIFPDSNRRIFAPKESYFYPEIIDSNPAYNYHIILVRTIDHLGELRPNDYDFGLDQIEGFNYNKINVFSPKFAYEYLNNQYKVKIPINSYVTNKSFQFKSAVTGGLSIEPPKTQPSEVSPGVRSLPEFGGYWPVDSYGKLSMPLRFFLAREVKSSISSNVYELDIVATRPSNCDEIYLVQEI